jgi:hypothetical protein
MRQTDALKTSSLMLNLWADQTIDTFLLSQGSKKRQFQPICGVDETAAGVETAIFKGG